MLFYQAAGSKLLCLLDSCTILLADGLREKLHSFYTHMVWCAIIVGCEEIHNVLGHLFLLRA